MGDSIALPVGFLAVVQVYRLFKPGIFGRFAKVRYLESYRRRGEVIDAHKWVEEDNEDEWRYR